MPHLNHVPPVSVLLLAGEKQRLTPIENVLTSHCPQIKICRKVTTLEHFSLPVDLSLPDLIIIDIQDEEDRAFPILNRLSSLEREVIVVAQMKSLAYEALKFSVSGFVLKPIQPGDLALAVRKACEKIHLRQEYQSSKDLIRKLSSKLSKDDLIGIPTMEGFDFIRIGDIIRCQGMQRCTQLVTLQRSNIISSYNLGEFIKLLEPFGFFSPHKSHLINLNCIKKYRKEGSILMINEVNVPISRRRKTDFLHSISYLSASAGSE